MRQPTTFANHEVIICPVPTLRKISVVATGIGAWIIAFGDPVTLTSATGAQAISQEMFVSVLDENGDPVLNLGVHEFVVLEDGAQHEILHVSRAKMPLQVAILVDTSHGAISTIPDIRRGLHKFLDGIHERNTLSIITFGGSPKILVGSTQNRDRLRVSIDRLFGSSFTGSYLLDALTETILGFQKREVTRSAMVVVTTDGTDFSNRTHTEVLKSLSQNGIALHTIILPSEKRAQDPLGFGSSWQTGPAETWNCRDLKINQEHSRNETRNRDFLLTLGPDATGGRRSDLLTSMRLEDELAAVAKELSSQYLVVYARPQTLIPPSQIEVNMRRTNFSVRGTPARVMRGG